MYSMNQEDLSRVRFMLTSWENSARRPRIRKKQIVGRSFLWMGLQTNREVGLASFLDDQMGY